VRGLSEYVKIVEEIPFTHIRRRMIRIKPSIGNDNHNEEPRTLNAIDVWWRYDPCVKKKSVTLVVGNNNISF